MKPIVKIRIMQFGDRMFYLVPPSGAPFSFGDFARIIGDRIRNNSYDNDSMGKFKEYFGMEFCFFLNSGRSSLTIVLNTLSELSDPNKSEVIIPAYTCFSVAAAVARSKLKIRLVDINPFTMDYDYSNLEKLDFTKVLAIVGCNLFGILNDWRRLREITETNNVYLIDDAAQSMGSFYNQKPSGSLGDVGFYSLGRGKNLSIYSGGIITTNNDEIAGGVRQSIEKLKSVRLLKEVSIVLKIGLSNLFLKPWYYWVPAKLPFLGLGISNFNKDFDIMTLSKIQTSALNILLDNLAFMNETRSKNSAKMAGILLEGGQYKISGYDSSNCPNYLRLPLICENTMKRNQAIIKLREAGIVASSMYPSTIQKITGIEKYLASTADNFPGAQTVVDKILCLPTHSYLADKDIMKITKCLNEY